MNGISFLLEKRNTKLTGDISELRVMTDLARAGYYLSIPFGENHRYDVVIERDGVFKSVQIKTGRLRKGSILFNCFSSHAHRGGLACRRYTGEVDYFGVYCPQNDCTYLVPITEIPVQTGCLRVEPARNCQQRKLRWAEPYLLYSGPNAPGKNVMSAKAPVLPFPPP